jgi:NTP pyrophosphatase (non-canonical NTP hydrolase)
MKPAHEVFTIDDVHGHLVFVDAVTLELIALLAEEAGEVVQVCGKILRHGMYSHHPVTKVTNNESLHRELGDVFAVIQLLERDLNISMPEIRARARDKHSRLAPYLHHAKPMKS